MDCHLKKEKVINTDTLEACKWQLLMVYGLVHGWLEKMSEQITHSLEDLTE